MESEQKPAVIVQEQPKSNTALWILALIVVFVLGYVSASWKQRYEISAASGAGCYVIDNHTGQVWLMASGASIDLGTPQEPKRPVKTLPEENNQPE